MEPTPDLSQKQALRTARRRFMLLGLGCFVILLSASLLQPLFMRLLPDNKWTLWIYTFAPIYLIAMPLGCLIFRAVPKSNLAQARLTAGQLVVIVFISLFMMYASNFVGVLITTAISMLTGVSNDLPLNDYIMADSWPLKILVMVVLAPMLEEYVFRKQLLDRMVPYGSKLAVVTSALIFGLFHGNLNQFIYATALGLVLGYVYLRTGRLRYTIGIHMGVNFLGSVVSGLILENLDLEALEDPERAMEAMLSPAFLAYCVLLVFILGAMVTGLVLLCIFGKRIRFGRTSQQLPKGKGFVTAWCNVGMILFTALCLFSIVMSLL